MLRGRIEARRALLPFLDTDYCLTHKHCMPLSDSSLNQLGQAELSTKPFAMRAVSYPDSLTEPSISQVRSENSVVAAQSHWSDSATTGSRRDVSPNRNRLVTPLLETFPIALFEARLGFTSSLVETSPNESAQPRPQMLGSPNRLAANNEGKRVDPSNQLFEGFSEPRTFRMILGAPLYGRNARRGDVSSKSSRARSESRELAVLGNCKRSCPCPTFSTFLSVRGLRSWPYWCCCTPWPRPRKIAC